MRTLFVYPLWLAPSLLLAQTVSVDVRDVTSTQAIVHVTAANADGSPYAGSCTYQISEGLSLGTLVNDVNPALFAGSSSDARPGSIVSGRDRYFVAGTRTVQQAVDNNWYSRALQALTQHTVGVTCGASGPVTKIFTTKTIPAGETYPEPPPFSSAAFGNRPVPTINWADQSRSTSTL